MSTTTKLESTWGSLMVALNKVVKVDRLEISSMSNHRKMKF